MRIAVLPPPAGQKRLFSARAWERLQSMGTVACNEVEEKPTEDSIAGLITGADIVITSWGTPALTPRLLDCAPQLKAVIHAAGTVKPIVTPALWERGIRVSSGNNALAIGVAETALGFTIATLKNMWALTQNMRDGQWTKGRGDVRELYEVTVGVVGAGRAGQHYIRLLRQFHVDVLVYDPVMDAQTIAAYGGTKADLDTLLARCDVISIHAPSLPATYHMFNQERLAAMKDDAILINTARGSIIDEKALEAELRKGRLIACLDVTDPEPAPPDHPLRQLPNCMMTPHIAGAVTNGLKRLGAFAVDEIARLQQGEPLEGEVKEEQMAVLA